MSLWIGQLGNHASRKTIDLINWLIDWLIVCTPRSKRPCRKAKVCIPRSLHRQTNKGKCVSLVLKCTTNNDEQTGEVCITRCKSFQRADLHGTIFVACILKHVLKCCDNRNTCGRPVVRLSHETKIVPCKSTLRASASIQGCLITSQLQTLLWYIAVPQ